MIRVVASIVNSDFNDQFRQQREDLVDWINEIVEAAFRLQSVSVCVRVCRQLELILAFLEFLAEHQLDAQLPERDFNILRSCIVRPADFSGLPPRPTRNFVSRVAVRRRRDAPVNLFARQRPDWHLGSGSQPSVI